MKKTETKPTSWEESIKNKSVLKKLHQVTKSKRWISDITYFNSTITKSFERCRGTFFNKRRKRWYNQKQRARLYAAGYFCKNYLPF